MSDLLKASDVAKLLGCSTSSIWRWSKQGLLRPRRVGRGCTRWVLAEVKALIASAPTAKSGLNGV